jgi:uncharacterized damage-inducible protein DinB
LSETGSLASVLRLNTRLFLNCLEGVSDRKAVERPNQLTNSLAFLGCHLVDSRHFLATQLGLDEVNPFAERLQHVQAIEQMESFPGLAEIRSAWRALAPVLEECVAGLSATEVRAASRARFPVDDPSVAGMVAFLIQHESYHIGQMALIRKHHGYPAMKY